MTSYFTTGSFCREVFEGEGSCYKMVHAEVTWSQARAYCRHLAAGADLVSIESEDEQIYLVDVILGDVSFITTVS